MIEEFIKKGIEASRENGDYWPLGDGEFDRKRREIQEFFEVEHGQFRSLSYQMGEAFIETQTADNGAKQKKYIDLVIDRIKEKALRIFDLEALLLELDLRFAPIEKEILEKIIN